VHGVALWFSEAGGSRRAIAGRYVEIILRSVERREKASRQSVGSRCDEISCTDRRSASWTAFTDKSKRRTWRRCVRVPGLAPAGSGHQADCEIGGPHLYVRTIPAGGTHQGRPAHRARTAAEEADTTVRSPGWRRVGLDLSYILSRPNKERLCERLSRDDHELEDFAVFGFLIDRVDGTSWRVPRRQLRPAGPHPARRHRRGARSIEYGQNKTPSLPPRAARVEREDSAGRHAGTPRRSTYSQHQLTALGAIPPLGDQRRTNTQRREQYIREVNPSSRPWG